jgi:hypothetical protein
LCVFLHRPHQQIMVNVIERAHTLIPLSTTHRWTIRRKSRSPIPPIRSSGAALRCSRPARAPTAWAISSWSTAARWCCVCPTRPLVWSPHRQSRSQGLNSPRMP